MPAALEARLRRLEAQQRAVPRAPTDYSRYVGDPVEYARQVLGVRWWSKQEEVAQAVLEHDRVFVKASHGVGKTHLAGGLVNWHFDAFNPSITLTTAPTAPQVYDLTWKEVRLQRGGRGMLPKAPRLEGTFPDGRINPAHLAAGYTARDAEAFQGRHEEHLFVLFEEACGIDQEFWTAAEGMLSSGRHNRWLCILNPTDQASPAYQAELSGRWHTISISALDHPNIAAQLRGLPKPFPKAVDLSWVEERIRLWCTPCPAAEASATDFQWPPAGFCAETGAEPKWYRPGALFEGKVLGRWPSQATTGVWSDADWMAAETAVLAEPHDALPVIGCDPARFGDDFTAIHVRRGPVSLHHESVNGWGTDQTAGRLKQLAREYAAYYKRAVPDWNGRPEQIPVNVDVDGLGSGVVDQRGDYNFIGISSASTSARPLDYPNRRSELWFNGSERARYGRMDLSRLPAAVRQELKQQALQVTWKVDGDGRCVVEKKEDLKKRLGRSPDDMDGLNLAYLDPLPFCIPASGKREPRSLEPQRESAAARRGMFGRS